jgi:hypothetical protein
MTGEPTAETTEGPAEPEVAPPEPAVAPAEPEGIPRFEARAYWVPKRGNTVEEFEDGFDIDAVGGSLALADGAGDGVFTKSWVLQLLSSFRDRPVALNDMDAVFEWINGQRRAWFEAIDYPSLRLSLQRKVDRSCASATFLAFRLDQDGVADSNADAGAGVGWTAWAVGDVCLFHVRGGDLIAWFPVTQSADFGTTPELYQSRPLRSIPEAGELRGEILPDDLLVFATDAQACALLGAVEAGEPPDWGGLWDAGLDAWRDGVERDRDAGKIVNDDCTLLMLRLPRRASPEEASAEGPPADLHEGPPAPPADVEPV